MRDKRIAVVGSGIGGLACALRLAHEGLQVTVFERDTRLGGKLRVEEVSGQKIDSGPTVFTMKWVFEELLASVGAHLAHEIKLTPLPIIGRHFWADGSSLDLFADAHASESAVRDFAGVLWVLLRKQHYKKQVGLKRKQKSFVCWSWGRQAG